MKIVNFNRLSVKNFLSIGSDTVVVDFRSGINIITGINRDQIDRRNGVGKSAIVDAFYFAIFGTTIRELKKEFIINNVNSNTCEVSLTFDIKNGDKVESYELIRTLEPSKCLLFKDGIDVTRDSIINTTLKVQEILGINQEVFQNCVVMTINNTVPFMAQKKVEKRKFIENIFNLEIFSKMNTFLKEDLSDNKKQLDVEGSKYEEIEKVFNSLNTAKERKEQERKSKINNLQKRLDDNNKNLETIESRITKYKFIDSDKVKESVVCLKEKLSTCEDSIQKLGKDIATITTKKEYAFKDLNKLGTDKDICPVCLTPVTEKDRKHIKDRKKEYQDAINLFENELEKHERDLEDKSKLKRDINHTVAKLEESINKNKLLKQQKANDEQKIIDLKKLIDQNQKDLKDAMTEQSESSTELVTMGEELKLLRSKITDIKSKLNMLETVKFIISEEGVKSFIVKKILKLFNSKLAFYLNKLNSNAVIVFNEVFEETIFNEKGKLTCYFNYSGAERRVIDLAIMFTFIDMLRLQSNTHFNIQFYDELLDTSLDESGVEMVVNLLNEISSKYNIGAYIISHRKECSKISNGEVIMLEKTNGITKRVSVDNF